MTRRMRIHPAIGTARMGNSPDGFFIGPEVPGVPANWNANEGKFNSFRDAEGRILRQGARFRVFDYGAPGENKEPEEVVVGGDIVDIEWRVHLANRKASFFTFDGQSGADDAYQARSNVAAKQIVKQDPPRTNLRNAQVEAADRERLLDIDPGERMISHARPEPVELSNDKSHIPIATLGQLRIDAQGRLTVLGGLGVSNSNTTPPTRIDEYANNDGWFDDAGDGSVKARILFADGTHVDADPAWVFVGPPDFAPGIGNVVSLFDTLWDVAVREIPIPDDTPRTPALRAIDAQKAAWTAGGNTLGKFKPSFAEDIYPLLKRALAVRDLHDPGEGNRQYHVATLDWERLASLTGPDVDDARDLRQTVFGRMRDPDASDVVWTAMPRGLGDDYTTLDGGAPSPKSFLSLTRIQYAMLRAWSEGNFISDWPGEEPGIPVSVPITPDGLDKAALENSVGGPFFPGIEVSWLIRRKELFVEPLRLAVLACPISETASEPVTVGALTFRPGFFSQQMALPWQADFYDCHKEQHDGPDDKRYFFMWWTAQRPDDVFPAGENEQKRWVRVFDAQSTAEEPDADENLERFNQMQTRWSELRFVSVFNEELERYEEEPTQT